MLSNSLGIRVKLAELQIPLHITRSPNGICLTWGQKTLCACAFSSFFFVLHKLIIKPGNTHSSVPVQRKEPLMMLCELHRSVPGTISAQGKGGKAPHSSPDFFFFAGQAGITPVARQGRTSIGKRAAWAHGWRARESQRLCMIPDRDCPRGWI